MWALALLALAALAADLSVHIAALIYHDYRRSDVRTVSGLLLIFYLQIALHLLYLATGRNIRPSGVPREAGATRFLVMTWRWSKG